MTNQLNQGHTWRQDSEIPALAGLRGFAALWVYGFHLWGVSGYPKFEASIGLKLDFTPIIALGGAGVTLFFVLSGFLLSLPFVRWHSGGGRRPDIGIYVVRRVARVFPAFHFQLLILLGVLVASQGLSALPPFSALWRHVLMFFMPAPLGTAPLNLVWWTLPIEFCFYLMLPLLAWTLRDRHKWLLLVGAWVLMWAWRKSTVLLLADQSLSDRVYASYQLFGSLDMFAAGMFVAILYAGRPGRAVSTSPYSSLPTVAGIAALIAACYWLAANRTLYWADNPIFYLWTPMLSAGTGLLIWAAMCGDGLVAAIFANRVMRYFGRISYGVYLWHLPILLWLAPTFAGGGDKHRNFAGLLALSAPLVTLAAALSYRWIEEPAIAWAHRRTRQG